MLTKSILACALAACVVAQYGPPPESQTSGPQQQLQQQQQQPQPQLGQRYFPNEHELVAAGPEQLAPSQHDQEVSGSEMPWRGGFARMPQESAHELEPTVTRPVSGPQQAPQYEVQGTEFPFPDGTHDAAPSKNYSRYLEQYWAEQQRGAQREQALLAGHAGQVGQPTPFTRPAMATVSGGRAPQALGGGSELEPTYETHRVTAVPFEGQQPVEETQEGRDRFVAGRPEVREQLAGPRPTFFPTGPAGRVVGAAPQEVGAPHLQQQVQPLPGAQPAQFQSAYGPSPVAAGGQGQLQRQPLPGTAGQPLGHFVRPAAEPVRLGAVGAYGGALLNQAVGGAYGGATAGAASSGPYGAAPSGTGLATGLSPYGFKKH